MKITLLAHDTLEEITHEFMNEILCDWALCIGKMLLANTMVCVCVCVSDFQFRRRVYSILVVSRFYPQPRPFSHPNWPARFYNMNKMGGMEREREKKKYAKIYLVKRM